MKKTCVIGSPISHSRSPLIHNYWLSKHRIEGEYKKKEVTKDELANFFQSFMENGYVGCNVTIPHKETVLPFIISDEKAKLLGAANTIYIEDDKLIGTNTDGEGFLMSLKSDIKKIILTYVNWKKSSDFFTILNVLLKLIFEHHRFHRNRLFFVVFCALFFVIRC